MTVHDIEPELDDIVEQHFGHQMLSSSRQLSELLVSLMTPGAIEPPTRATRESDLDPALVLDGAQEQLRRRLEQISPAAGRHYVGMRQALSEASRRVTPVADTFNNAREMISALAEVLRAVAGVDRDFLDAPDLGVPEDASQELTALIHDLADIMKASKRLQLHRVTHRNGVRQPRPMTTDLIDRAQSAEWVAEQFADLYEKNIDIVHAEIERLLGGTATKAGASRLSSLAAPDHAAVQSFFDRLDVPDWWIFLRGRKFFEGPPEPPEDLIHPRWPQSRYLARIASTADNPAELAELLCELGRGTRNIRVREDVLRAAAQLPPQHASRVLASEQSWAPIPLQWRVARLAMGLEIIRYPAWRAGLMARIAAHPDADPEERRFAEGSLRAALRVRMVTVDAQSTPEFVPEEMDAEAVLHVLLHLREHSSMEELALVTRLVTQNVQEISDELIRWTEGEERVEQEDPFDTEVLGWYLDDVGRHPSDMSHLVVHSCLGDHSNEGAEALDGLMVGLSGLLAATLARNGGGSELQPRGATHVRRTVGLMDRVRLTALLLIDPLPAQRAEESLTNPELAHAAVVREEYTQVLNRAWPVLGRESRQRIRSALAAGAAPGSVAELIGSAPLVGLEQESSEEGFVQRALAVTENPDVLLAVARGGSAGYARSAVQGDLLDAEAASARGQRFHPDVETLEHPADHIRRAGLDGEPSASRRGQQRSQLEQLRAQDSGPSADDWAEVLDVVAPRRLVMWTGAPSSGPESVRWISLLVDWVAQHDLPDSRNRRRLQQFVLHRRWGWAEAPKPSRPDQIAHHGLDLARASAHAQVLILKICILLRPRDGGGPLTEKQRQKMIRSFRADFASSSPLRPTLMTVVGQLLPLIHAGADDLWGEIVSPLLTELPELAPAESPEGSPRVPELTPHARDLAALYSGLIMSRARFSRGFTQETLPFLTWCYENLSALQIPSGIVPTPIVTHAYAVIISDALREDGPGSALRAILDSAPTLVTVGALRMFSEQEYDDAPEELGTTLRRLWTAISDWAEDNPERADVLATIGSWTANPELAILLGPDWSLSRIERILEARDALDVSNELFESFSVLADHSLELAERIVQVVRSMRRKGLLETQHGRGLGHLIAVLAALPVQPLHLAELRSALMADRLTGPLAGR